MGDRQKKTLNEPGSGALPAPKIFRGFVIHQDYYFGRWAITSTLYDSLSGCNAFLVSYAGEFKGLFSPVTPPSLSQH